MSKKPVWYIEERAEVLALVHLTRRDDLLATKQPHADSRINYIVEIIKEKRPTRRIFGVRVKARISPASKNLVSNLKALKIEYEPWMEELPFPLCLFFFTMENDEGFYIWLLEPSITEDGKPKLRLNKTGEFRKLDREALDTIVSQVNQWYDTLLQALAA